MARNTITNLNENITHNLPFEVVAVPQYANLHSLNNTSPINVKIRIRNKEDMANKHGIISKLAAYNSGKKVRLVKSDQTIMSFEFFPEVDTNKKDQKKNIFHIFKRGSSKSKNSSLIEDDSKNNIQDRISLRKNTPLSESLDPARKLRPFIGKCKPGGCLDPPFGEDYYTFKPIEKQPSDQTTDISNNKMNAKKSIDRKISKTKDDNVTKDLLNYEEISNIDSLITYPSTSSSIEKRYKDNNHYVKSKSRISSEDKARISVSEFSEIFFMPPKQESIKSKKVFQKDDKTEYEGIEVVSLEPIQNNTVQSGKQFKTSFGNESFTRNDNYNKINYLIDKNSNQSIIKTDAPKSTALLKNNNALNEDLTPLKHRTSNYSTNLKTFDSPKSINVIDEGYTKADKLSFSNEIYYNTCKNPDTKKKEFDFTTISDSSQNTSLNTRGPEEKNISDSPIIKDGHSNNNDSTEPPVEFTVPLENISVLNKELSEYKKPNNLNELKNPELSMISATKLKSSVIDKANIKADELSFHYESNNILCNNIETKKEVDLTQKFSENISPNLKKSNEKNISDDIILKDGHISNFIKIKDNPSLDIMIDSKSIEEINSSVENFLKPKIDNIDDISNLNITNVYNFDQYKKANKTEYTLNELQKEVKVNQRSESESDDKSQKSFYKTPEIEEVIDNNQPTSLQQSSLNETNVYVKDDDIFSVNSVTVANDKDLLVIPTLFKSLGTQNKDDAMSEAMVKHLLHLSKINLKISRNSLLIPDYYGVEPKTNITSINYDTPLFTRFTHDKDLEINKLEQSLKTKDDTYNKYKEISQSSSESKITTKIKHEVSIPTDALKTVSESSMKLHDTDESYLHKNNNVQKIKSKEATNHAKINNETNSIKSIIEKYSNNQDISNTSKYTTSIFSVPLLKPNPDEIFFSHKDISELDLCRISSTLTSTNDNKSETSKVPQESFENRFFKKMLNTSSNILQKYSSIDNLEIKLKDLEKSTDSRNIINLDSTSQYMINNKMNDIPNLKSSNVEYSQAHAYSSISVDFKFRSFVDDNNNLIITTLDSSATLDGQQSKISAIKSLVRENDDEIKIPINLDTDLTLQIKKCKESTFAFGETGTVDGNESSSQKDFLLQETLNSVYESLIPLEGIIRALKEEADLLTRHQALFKNTLSFMENKPMRLVKTDPMCGCNKEDVDS